MHAGSFASILILRISRGQTQRGRPGAPGARPNTARPEVSVLMRPEHRLGSFSQSHPSRDPRAPSCRRHRFVSRGSFPGPERNGLNTRGQNLHPGKTAFATELKWHQSC